MTRIKGIKENSRRILKNNLISPIAVVMTVLITGFALTEIYMLMLNMFSFVAEREDGSFNYLAILCFSPISILCYCIICPLIAGAVRWFWFFSIGKKQNVSSVFYYFSSAQVYFDSLYLSVGISLWSVLSIVAGSLPVIALGLINNFVGIPDIAEKPLFAVAVLLGIIIFLVIIPKIVPARLCYVINEGIPSETSLKISFSLMKKQTMSFIKTVISFLGWILLSLLGVTLVYTIPYGLTAYCVATRNLVINSRIECAKTGREKII